MYHALVYACHIFNILPVKGLFLGNHVSTPYELFQGIKLSISHFHVFRCPITARKWTAGNSSTSKQTKHGIRGIFFGLDQNQKGYILYAPASRRLCISANITFDEQFNSTIAHTWQLQHDSLALCPVSSDIPLATTTIEHTGEVMVPFVNKGVEDMPDTPAAHPPVDKLGDNDDNVPELVDGDDDSTAKYDSDSEIDDDEIIDLETPPKPEPASISPQPNTEQAGIRCSTPARKPNPKYTNAVRGNEWENTTVSPVYQQLACACAIEATPTLPTVGDALSWEPAPSSIRDILKMPNGTVCQEWLKSVKKELKTLVDSKTFEADNLQDGETSTPVMEIFKVKFNGDGSLHKLKTRLVVRGDLQDKRIMEGKWSPTASFRSLKMFLAHASRLKVRVKQLDFVGAFLQVKMHTRMFVTILKIFVILFPEYQWCMGKPVRLRMLMYGTTLCGKYWYLNLLDYLKGSGFKEGGSVKCLFIKQFADGAEIFLLNYVNNVIY